MSGQVFYSRESDAEMLLVMSRTMWRYWMDWSYHLRCRHGLHGSEPILLAMCSIHGKRFLIYSGSSH